MASLCGGCSFCGSSSAPSPTPPPPPTPPAPVPPCQSWCESDYIGGNNQGRHCSPGDMASLCGGCSFCGSSSAPSPTPLPPPTLPAPGPPCESWCESDYRGGN